MEKFSEEVVIAFFYGTIWCVCCVCWYSYNGTVRNIMRRYLYAVYKWRRWRCFQKRCRNTKNAYKRVKIVGADGQTDEGRVEKEMKRGKAYPLFFRVPVYTVYTHLRTFIRPM